MKILYILIIIIVLTLLTYIISRLSGNDKEDSIEFSIGISIGCLVSFIYILTVGGSIWLAIEFFKWLIN